MVQFLPVFGGSHMRKLTIVIAVAGLVATPAFAADMAVKAPPAAPAPVYNWTGWYAGVNAGASFGNAKTDYDVAPVTVTTNSAVIPVPGFAGSNTEYPSGFIGGVQIGYNWQFSPIWVAGLEADFQGADEKEINTLTSNFTVTGLFTTGSTVLNYETKIDWFGTVRGRLGYVWGNGDVLTYVTGGLAYGRVGVDGTSVISGTVGASPFSISHAVGHFNVNAGWVVGYGTEGKLLIPGWTYKIESLYLDLGHLHDTDPTECGSEGQPCIEAVTGGQTITNTHFTDWILRAGLNYQFH
jgi:outer membrane immunogenic protein